MAFNCSICHDFLSQTLVGLHLDDSDAGDCTFVAHISPISSVEVISTECGHVYHSECLDRWFDSQKGAPGVKCPTCRVIISKASCRRLFLSSISSEFVSKYTDLKSEVEVARNRIGQLETSLKFNQDQLEDVQDELQTARLDVERQAKEIQQLNSQVDEFMVQTAIENNWIDLVEELKTENSNLRVLLDKPLETASNNNAPEQPTPLRNLVAPTKFISDENGNLICNLPPTGKSTRSLKAEEKKVRGPVGTSNFNSIINCQELFKTTLDFKNAIATSGVDKVVAELKALVELESQQTRLVAPMVENALEIAISKQTSYLQVCEFLKESGVTIVRERLYLQKLKAVQHQVFPGSISSL